jgi:putative ABC transport system substrate-binding protein
MRRRACVLVLGGATIGPPSLRAQPNAIRLAGFLGTDLPGRAASDFVSFRQGLKQAGYVEGRKVAIEFRWAEGHYDHLAALAADLVNRKVDLIVAVATVGTVAARNATSTIPIVFAGGGDLVGAGLISGLAHPGGDLTGISIFSRGLHLKRLQLLSEVVPLVEVIALLVNPSNLASDSVVRDMNEAASANERRLAILKASTDSEIDAAFAALVHVYAGALVVASDPYLNSRREQIVTLAARNAIPALTR